MNNEDLLINPPAADPQPEPKSCWQRFVDFTLGHWSRLASLFGRGGPQVAPANLSGAQGEHSVRKK